MAPTEDLHFVRFVGEVIDPDSGEREGFLQVAFRMAGSGVLPTEEQALLEAELDWLTSHLEAPRRLSPFRDALRRGRSGASRRKAIAISWFKSTAGEHLQRARRVAALLERHGEQIEEISSERPGYVTHEDPFQVVAVPFRDRPV